MSAAVAIVTAGAQGIGLACGQAFIEAGMQLLIVDSDGMAGCEAQQRFGERARFVQGDVADEAVIVEAVKQAVAMGPLRSVVSNAGIMIRKPVHELTLDEWNRVLSVNLTSAFLLARYAAPHLAQTPGASMTLIASSRALQSEPDTEAYAASKGALVALSHALAMSLGPVRVNCVSPGWIDTSLWQRSDRRGEPQLSKADHAQHAAGRVGGPQDIAALVRFLASDEAGFITGAHYVVDGGMTRKMIYA